MITTYYPIHTRRITIARDVRTTDCPGDRSVIPVGKVGSRGVRKYDSRRDRVLDGLGGNLDEIA